MKKLYEFKEHQIVDIVKYTFKEYPFVSISKNNVVVNLDSANLEDLIDVFNTIENFNWIDNQYIIDNNNLYFVFHIYAK